MNTTSQNPATQNEAWGFYGSMDEQAQAAWPLALSAISGATGLSLDAARAYLTTRSSGPINRFANDVAA